MGRIRPDTLTGAAVRMSARCRQVVWSPVGEVLEDRWVCSPEFGSVTDREPPVGGMHRRVRAEGMTRITAGHVPSQQDREFLIPSTTVPAAERRSAAGERRRDTPTDGNHQTPGAHTVSDSRPVPGRYSNRNRGAGYGKSIAAASLINEPPGPSPGPDSLTTPIPGTTTRHW